MHRMASVSTPETVELKRLAADPDAQAAYAITLLRPKAPLAALQAALTVLERHPDPAARLGLLAVYAHYDGDGPRRDPGSFIRRATLAALRPISLPADVPLLLHAVTTVERLPPAFKDEAIPLRATALVALNQLDDRLAAYHAARLLVDPHADEMSGEPSLTAVRVLASMDNLLPLYAYAMQEGGLALPDVVSECLRSLVAIPVSLLPGVIERHGKSDSIAVLAGLCDLVIGHEAGPQGLEFVTDILTRTEDVDLLRYVTLAALARRDERLRHLALDAARWETRPARVAVYIEALEPFGADPDVRSVLERLYHNGV
jgi:hypothetical protein